MLKTIFPQNLDLVSMLECLAMLGYNKKLSFQKYELSGKKMSEVWKFNDVIQRNIAHCQSNYQGSGQDTAFMDLNHYKSWRQNPTFTIHPNGIESIRWKVGHIKSCWGPEQLEISDRRGWCVNLYNHFGKSQHLINLSVFIPHWVCNSMLEIHTYLRQKIRIRCS